MIFVRKFFKIVSINFLIFSTLILIIESSLGSWFTSENYGSLIIPRSSLEIINSPKYDSSGKYLFSRDENGFRANDYKLSQIDILVIGGSTTEERDVGDQYIWTKIFEKEISKFYNYKVLNAGIGGQTSLGHSLIFDLWINKYDDLKPKYIFIFVGINDAVNLFDINHNNKKIQNRVFQNEDKDKLINNNKFANFIKYTKNNSYFHAIYLNIRSKMLLNKFNFNYNKKNDIYDILKIGLPNKSHVISKLDYKNKNLINFKKLYQKNLSKILDQVYKKNAIPVFITQTIHDQDILYDYLEFINHLTIQFCENSNISCLKLNKNHNITKSDYYDTFHTNPKGSFKIGVLTGKMFIDEIKNNID